MLGLRPTAPGAIMPGAMLAAHGPTLSLRFPATGDATALFALASDPEVGRPFSWRWESPDEAARWIAGRPRARERGLWLEFTVDHREHGPVGITGLTEPSTRDRRAVTGSWLGRPYWGTGINTEAKALLARIAFDACRLERLGSYAGVGNPRSRRALEKLGFRHEGTLRAYHRHHGAGRDVDVLSLLRAEWAAGPLAAVPCTLEGAPSPAWRPS
jgi:[ribosomal protein S5]-alanine N-acetyltransferase